MTRESKTSTHVAYSAPTVTQLSRHLDMDLFEKYTIKYFCERFLLHPCYSAGKSIPRKFFGPQSPRYNRATLYMYNIAASKTIAARGRVEMTFEIIKKVAHTSYV